MTLRRRVGVGRPRDLHGDTGKRCHANKRHEHPGQPSHGRVLCITTRIFYPPRRWRDFFYDQVHPAVAEVQLVSTYQFAVIAKSMKKIARNDALALARLLKLGCLPTVAMPETRIREPGTRTPDAQCAGFETWRSSRAPIFWSKRRRCRDGRVPNLGRYGSRRPDVELTRPAIR
jgi:hypothetical protein